MSTKKHSEDISAGSEGCNGISVLIPALNASSTINSAILSAWFFSPKGSEILVYVDGGNTETRILNLMVKFGLVKLFRSSTTQGPANAMNILIASASRRFVARLDADDIMLPRSHHKSIRVIDGDQADIVFSNAIFFGRRLRVLPCLPQIPFSIKSPDVPAFLAFKNPFVQSSMLARKEVLNRAGGYLDGIAEDYELWLRCQVEGIRMVRLARYGVLYRIHPGQLTDSDGYAQRVLDRAAITQLQLSVAKSFLGQELEELTLSEAQAIIRERLSRTNFGFRLEGILKKNLTTDA